MTSEPCQNIKTTKISQKSQKIFTFDLRFCQKKHSTHDFLSFKKKFKFFPQIWVTKKQKHFRGPSVEQPLIWHDVVGCKFFWNSLFSKFLERNFFKKIQKFAMHLKSLKTKCRPNLNFFVQKKVHRLTCVFCQNHAFNCLEAVTDIGCFWGTIWANLQSNPGFIIVVLTNCRSIQKNKS